MCQDAKKICLDIATPRNVPLSALYKRSFGYYTLKERYPVILTQLIDNLVRNKHEIAAENAPGADKDLKDAIGEISKLKYEIQTNKPIGKFCINKDSPSDLKFYNDYLQNETERINSTLDWYNSKWLHNECYLHRKLSDIFHKTCNLNFFDHYRFKKEESFTKAHTQFVEAGTFLLQLVTSFKGKYNVEEKFIELLKMNLWGNKCDLSFSNGVINFAATKSDDDIDDEGTKSMSSLDEFIVVDDCDKIWKAVSTCSEKNTIDIILDNVGYELFTDLCIADYIITHNMAKKIRFYVKKLPWYLSDVTSSDFHWTLRQMGDSEDKHLNDLSKRWLKYIDNQIFTIEVHDFWTLPVGFCHMKAIDTSLYDKLSEAKFAFFKGDLNYRKLFDDINWEPTTSTDVALQGFHPTKFCSLRTVKSDILTALKKGVMEKIEEKQEKWAYSGDFGVIMYVEGPTCSAE